MFQFEQLSHPCRQGRVCDAVQTGEFDENMAAIEFLYDSPDLTSPNTPFRVLAERGYYIQGSHRGI